MTFFSTRFCKARMLAGSFALLLAHTVAAQPVSTRTLPQAIPSDGLAVGADGAVYVAGGWDQQAIHRIEPDGAVTPFISGVQGPIHMTWDGAGNLYFSEFLGGRVRKVTPQGVMTVYAIVGNGPAGVAVDSQGHLFVSLFGFNGNDNRIVRVAPDGAVRQFVRGQGIQAASPLALDENDNLYVGNHDDGKIHRVTPAGGVSLLATLPGPTGRGHINHMAYHDGALYVTGGLAHQVFRVTLDGTVEAWAGSGTAGHADGTRAEAQFNGPNGLALSPAGDTMYVTTGGQTNRLRQIATHAPTGAHRPAEVSPTFRLHGVTPNPFSGQATLTYELRQPAAVQLSIHDLLGRQVAAVNAGMRPVGQHRLVVEAEGWPPGLYFYQLQAEGHLLSGSLLHL